MKFTPINWWLVKIFIWRDLGLLTIVRVAPSNKPIIVTELVNTRQMFSMKNVPCQAHFRHHCHIQPYKGQFVDKSRLHSSLSQHKHVSVPPLSNSYKNLILYLLLQQETQSKPTWLCPPPPSLSVVQKLHHRVSMEGFRLRQGGRPGCTLMKVRPCSRNHILSIVFSTLTLGFV